jgi:protein-S-isoprenylcysteine O-methyltransferase Ste14
MTSSQTFEAWTSNKLTAWMFVVVQVLLLAAVFLLPGSDDWRAPGWVATAARGVQVIGAVVIVAAAANLGRSLTPLPTPVADGELRTNGLYRYVRHPIYSGVMAIVAGGAVRSRSILVAAFAVALVCWLMLKARWEERRLSERFGEYRGYMSRTPRFVPRASATR